MCAMVALAADFSPSPMEEKVMAKYQVQHTVQKTVLLLWKLTAIPIVVQVGRLRRKWTLRELLVGILVIQLVSILLF